MTIKTTARVHMLAILTCAIGLSACSGNQDPVESRPAWNDINVIRENTELPRAHFVPFRDESNFGPNRMSLNGSWKFSFAESPIARPVNFYQQDYDVSSWADTPVPSNWEREGYGYAIYVNVPYPFEIDEPNVPVEENPVGSYRRDFTLPDAWQGQQVFLQMGAVSSAFYVWINGEYVGYSEGSKTASEFRVTDHLQPGENSIAIEVYRWSTGSYLEDQDFWSLSGIQRDVTLTARPNIRVRDFFVHADLQNDYRDGAFKVDIELVNDSTDAVARNITVEIRDADELVYANSASLTMAPGASAITFETTIDEVRQWSAEMPHQYTMRISMDGDDTETIEQKIGFRNVAIVNGKFLVNGKHVRLKGANLHEHHDDKGHVIDEETMLRDIEMMKAANLNAVRNSHYPHQERWYELTSEHGLYVVDEANIESHGYGYGNGKTLANKPHWMAHHLDRTRRMLERSKNFPSVVIWSLGNEAGNGMNMDATYDWINSRDRSRPIQYESEHATEQFDESNSDFHSAMYWRYWDIEEYAQTNSDKPLFLMEYAHSMGNSTGNLSDYWDVINQHDIVAGAFIWDWVDQGLLEHDEDGTPYWTYGGDYGPADVPSSGNFNFNGVVFPDRKAQPAYWEVKRAYQYVDFRPVDIAGGDIMVVNNYDFIDLSAFELEWEVAADGRAVQSGVVRDIDINAESEGTLRLQYSLRGLRAGPAYHLNLHLRGKEQRGLMPAGHVYASAQFELPGSAEGFSEPVKGDAALTVQQREDAVQVSSEGFSTTIDTASGLLSSVNWAGNELLLTPLTPNFWRAPTDNDFGNYMQDWAAVWEQAGRNRSLKSLQVTQSSSSRASVAAEYEFFDSDGAGIATWRTVFTFYPSGAIEVDNHFEPASNLPALPRVGMNVELVAGLDSVEWLGRGPFENYSDRKLAANIGRYQNTVADHYVPYLRPQENGYKTDTSWLALSSRDYGLLVVTDEVFSFGVHNNRLSDFVPPVKIAITREDGPEARVDDARVNIHVNDIKPRPLVSLDIDYGQMGVGGDDSWGKRTLQKYMLDETSFHYQFVLRPFTPGGGRMDQLIHR